MGASFNLARLAIGQVGGLQVADTVDSCLFGGDETPLAGRNVRHPPRSLSGPKSPVVPSRKAGAAS